MKKYTNKDLACEYARIVAAHTFGIDSYLAIKRRIEGSCIDLAAFYQEHRSLADLKIKGIGSKTRRVLELILGEGAEEARKIISGENKKRYDRKIEKMREEQWRGLPTEKKLIRGNPDPSFENAVRLHEDY